VEWSGDGVWVWVGRRGVAPGSDWRLAGLLLLSILEQQVETTLIVWTLGLAH